MAPPSKYQYKRLVALTLADADASLFCRSLQAFIGKDFCIPGAEAPLIAQMLDAGANAYRANSSSPFFDLVVASLSLAPSLFDATLYLRRGRGAREWVPISESPRAFVERHAGWSVEMLPRASGSAASRDCAASVLAAHVLTSNQYFHLFGAGLPPFAQATRRTGSAEGDRT